MRLREFLDVSGEHQSAFAQRVGTSVSTISRLVNGNVRPSLKLALQIKAATGGLVTIEDLWTEADRAA